MDVLVRVSTIAARIQTTLRPATIDDAGAVARLATEAFVAKFGHLYRDQDLNVFLAQAMSERAFTADLQNPDRAIMLAERSGEPVAFAKVSYVCGFPEHARGQRPMELKQLYTAPTSTGGGLGTALMAWVLSDLTARGADEIQLSVYAENVDAHRFYQRFGFEKVADITFQVGEHIDHDFLLARLV